MNPWTDLPKNSIGKLGRITGILLAIDLVGRFFSRQRCVSKVCCIINFSFPSICAIEKIEKYFMRNKLFPWSFLNIATFNDGTFFLEFIFVRRNQCVL